MCSKETAKRALQLTAKSATLLHCSAFLPSLMRERFKRSQQTHSNGTQICHSDHP